MIESKRGCIVDGKAGIVEELNRPEYIGEWIA